MLNISSDYDYIRTEESLSSLKDIKSCLNYKRLLNFMFKKKEKIIGSSVSVCVLDISIWTI